MYTDPTDLVAQQEAEESRREQEKLRVRTEKNDIKWLMDQVVGRRVVFGIMKRGGVVGTLESFFNQNALRMAFLEGASVEAKELHNKIMETCPKAYALMVKENSNE